MTYRSHLAEKAVTKAKVTDAGGGRRGEVHAGISPFSYQKKSVQKYKMTPKPIISDTNKLLEKNSHGRGGGGGGTHKKHPKKQVEKMEQKKQQ